MRNRVVMAAALALLAGLAYWPALLQPYIADDYVQVQFARQWGPVSGWASLAQDALYRCRATSLVMTWWTERLLGVDAVVLYATAILMHMLNTLLVAAVGFWPWIGWRVAIPAAVFFAVAECHNEAVMWYAALPELLVFFWILIAVHAWVLWLRTGRRLWYGATLIAYVVALGSKESAAIVPGLLAVPLLFQKDWRRLMWLAPLFVIGGLYAWGIAAAKATHLHLNDGTFSLHAPVFVTLRNSVGRLLWIWGFLALLLVWRRREAWWAMVWIVLALLPYSFLTYMPRVPSRHTYLASAGLAVLVGLAWVALRDSRRLRWHTTAAMALFVVSINLGYLWTRKRAQFLERAEPTEALQVLARRQPGPIHVRCFPYAQVTAELALEMNGHDPRRLVFSPDPPAQATDFCWSAPGKRAQEPRLSRGGDIDAIRTEAISRLAEPGR